MTKEREQLSVDLADRSLSVKKLLEENTNLQLRLKKAQEEADKLVALTGGNLPNGNGEVLDKNKGRGIL